MICGLNEAIAYEKGELEIRTVKVSVDPSPDRTSDKTWETFLNGINGFKEDYFEILENRHNDTISSEREILSNNRQNTPTSKRTK